MSAQSVELVRAVYDAWLRGERGYEHFDAQIEMVESSALPGAACVRGLDAVGRYMDSFTKYWEEIRFEPQEYIDAGDRVVVVARLVGRGKGSGVSVQRTWAYVWTVRAGKVRRMEGYADRAEALEAVRASA